MYGRILRWVIGVAAVLALTCVLAVIGIIFYTRTESFHTLLRTRVLAVLNDSLNAEVKFSRVTGSIWGRIVIHDVQISQNGAPVLSAPTVSIDVGLLGQIYTFLSSSSLRISQIDIDRPTVDAVQGPDQRWNILK